jgi:hypothetical protein
MIERVRVRGGVGSNGVVTGNTSAEFDRRISSRIRWKSILGVGIIGASRVNSASSNDVALVIV